MITWCCFNLRFLSSIQSVVNLRSSWEIWLTELNFCSEGFSEISFSYFSFVAFSYFSKGNWIWLTQIIRAYPGHNPPTFSCPCLSWKGGSREQVCVYRVQRILKGLEKWHSLELENSKPIPILCPIPKISETDTDTFFDTKIFRNRYRYFFRYQKFSKPIPIPSNKMEKFRNREVSKPKCHTLAFAILAMFKKTFEFWFVLSWVGCPATPWKLTSEFQLWKLISDSVNLKIWKCALLNN